MDSIQNFPKIENNFIFFRWKWFTKFPQNFRQKSRFLTQTCWEKATFSVEIEIFVKNQRYLIRNSRQNGNSWPKSKILTKIQVSDDKILSSKIEIYDENRRFLKNRNLWLRSKFFLKKSKFWTKIKIFLNNRFQMKIDIFAQKSKFATKIASFPQKSIFQMKIDIFHQK